ncbi:MAG TPA: type II 3-dehydroquinate dehydratase [Actinomycetota bacterium]|nr:type II 3-dehydroquinate dehydratase [Actinomycetota bacterium]
MTAFRRVLVLHGPNLNLLGRREPEVYGSLTLEEINERIERAAKELAVEVRIRQTNLEGELVEEIQRSATEADGVVINPGGYSHTSVAIRDAIAAIDLPVIEVHLSNPQAREGFRHTDIVGGACRGIIAGLGWRGYALAIGVLVDPEAGAASPDAGP